MTGPAAARPARSPSDGATTQIYTQVSIRAIYTQVSIRALQAVHAATHPGATNTRHRSVPPEFCTDPVGSADDDAARTDRDVMTNDPRHVDPIADVEVLFCVLDQEIDQENRADPGSPGITLPSRKSS